MASCLSEESLFVIWPLSRFEKDFELVKPAIGRGQYGEVFKARPRSSRTTLTLTKIDPESHPIVAAKFIKCTRATEQLRIRDEIDILKELNHPNVLQLLGAYESDNEFVQVLEYLRYSIS